MTYLNAMQVDTLLKPINKNRVLSRSGMAYVEAHDIKAQLSRIFGLANWSSEVIEQKCLFDTQVTMSNDKPGYNVCWHSIVRLTVCALDGSPLAVYTEGHVGDSTHPVRSEAHGNAVTNSESYALKRCAIALGSTFGLSLYNKGSLDEIVRWTLNDPRREDSPVAGVVEDDAPKVEAESLQPDPVPEVRETNRPEPAADVESDVRVAQANAIRAEALEAKTAREITQLMVAAGRQSLNNIMVDSAVGPHRIALKQFLDNQIKTVAAASRVAS